MPVQVERRTFNVEEYHRMLDAGIITEDDRVELIEGEILMMSPIGSWHAACVNRLDALLHRLFGESVIISVQNPIRLSDFSEPQPDLAVLRARQDYYAQTHPTSNDILLLIEVADQSLEFDRDVKVPLYAKAAIFGSRNRSCCAVSRSYGSSGTSRDLRRPLRIGDAKED